MAVKNPFRYTDSYDLRINYTENTNYPKAEDYVLKPEQIIINSYNDFS
jgi:hypothetical protein